MIKFLLVSLFATSILSATFAKAADQELLTKATELRIELDRINFDLKEDAKLKRLETMVSQTKDLVDKNPRDPAFLMMAGLYNIQYASELGNLSALKYAKAAREYLTSSVEIDPTIYGASAHAVLGRMYVSVPGWPIGFGNKKKGLLNFKKAIEIAPEGMDSNFMYAAYLFEDKQYVKAKKHFKKAKIATARPNRERADKKLHEIIDAILIEIEAKLS
jgi:tetratricopeptide (TPR) repeat protein